MRYPGGKNAAGTFQRIINQIPPHRVFVELFAGSAAITRHKRPAMQTHLIDLDWKALDRLVGHLPPNVTRSNAEAVQWLRFTLDPERCGDPVAGDWFIYADPPYVNTRCRYEHNLSPGEHGQLLRLLTAAPCRVMISGYRSMQYNALLRDWRRLDFEVMTRGGSKAIESLWMNYPEPKVLHDPRYAGGNYRVRENLARKKRRWKARIEAMPPAERQILLEALTGGLDAAERAALLRSLQELPALTWPPPAEMPVGAQSTPPLRPTRGNRRSSRRK